MRELYRYFRLRGQSTLSSSVLAEDAALPEARAPADTPGTAATTTVVDPDALVLDNSNKTLNSFAQLAALQLNVERALIAYVLVPIDGLY